jgi:hypothetical protein
MTDGTFRGLALVTRESNVLVLVAPIRHDEVCLMNLAVKTLDMRWEDIAARCRVIEVEVSERMN